MQATEERSLHTGEVEGSIQTAPTIKAVYLWAFLIAASSLSGKLRAIGGLEMLTTTPMHKSSSK